ncbi:MAG: tetratricopeptide repeat protein [Acidobacteriota bacterium]
MKLTPAFVLSVVIVVLGSAVAFAQTIPDDANHLPRKMGNDSPTSNIVVSGRVTLDGFPANEPRPAIYIAAYINGSLIVRRQASESGSFSITDVPRGEVTIVVEIDHNEVASRQLDYTPALVVYQDFVVSWLQVSGKRQRSGVVSVDALYTRSRDGQNRFERAVSDIRTGKNDSAITDLRTIVKEDPKDFYAWTQLGNAYFLKKDYKNAEDAYLHAITGDPNYPLSSVNLGKLYLTQNNFDRAIEILTRAVTAEPLSADAQQYLGEAYLGIKKGSKAVGYLNEAIRLAPIEKAEIHLRLAALYNGAGLKSQASAEYQKFLDKVPNYERSAELRKYIAENPPGQ